MVGWCFFKGYITFGISLIPGFYGMLCSGEIIGLLGSHITVAPQDSQVLVSLGLTKGGRRQGAAESVVVGVELAVKLVRAWKLKAPATARLATSPGKWRSLFSECLEALQLSQFQFRPYSLRRGGATWWFQKHQSLDRILVQGRWAAPKTARIYLNEGLEMLARMQFPMRDPRILPYLTVFHNMSKSPFFKTLEPPPKGGRPGGRGKKNKRRRKRALEFTACRRAHAQRPQFFLLFTTNLLLSVGEEVWLGRTLKRGNFYWLSWGLARKVREVFLLS